MAGLLLRSIGSSSLVLNPLTRGSPSVSGLRKIYSPAALGLDNFTSNREKTLIQFVNVAEKFREKMRQVLETQSHNTTIFTEDLKNAVFLAEANEEDVNMVLGMAKKFNQQNRGLRFGTFIFGPVVMRMFHHLKQPDAAITALQMEELDGFFDQMSSYQIALDLLYDLGRYDDVLKIFEDMQNKRLQGTKYPKSCLTIAVAAYYQINTEESFKKMQELLKDAEECGITISRRNIIFIAALALKQNYPHVTLEYLNKVQHVTQIAIRNLRILALLELERFDDVLPLLRSIVHVDIPDSSINSKKPGIFKETVAAVEAAAEKMSDKTLKSEFSRLLRSFVENQQISNISLDEYVCQPINKVNKDDTRQDKALLAASFNRNIYKNNRHPKKYVQHRKGLMERE